MHKYLLSYTELRFSLYLIHSQLYQDISTLPGYFYIKHKCNERHGSLFLKGRESCKIMEIQKTNVPGYLNQFSINPETPFKIRDKFTSVKTKGIKSSQGHFQLL